MISQTLCPLIADCRPFFCWAFTSMISTLGPASSSLHHGQDSSRVETHCQTSAWRMHCSTIKVAIDLQLSLFDCASSINRCSTHPHGQDTTWVETLCWSSDSTRPMLPSLLFRHPLTEHHPSSGPSVCLWPLLLGCAILAADASAPCQQLVHHVTRSSNGPPWVSSTTNFLWPSWKPSG